MLFGVVKDGFKRASVRIVRRVILGRCMLHGGDSVCGLSLGPERCGGRVELI